MSNTRCAACKSLRRKCSKDCVLAPYFPANDPERFSSVHQIYGASNVTKNIEGVPLHTRSDAAKCIVFEARARVQDPVYGCTRMITQLQQQIIQTQHEIEIIQGEIMVHRAREQIFKHELCQQPSWINTTLSNIEEQEDFQLDDVIQFGNF